MSPAVAPLAPFRILHVLAAVALALAGGCRTVPPSARAPVASAPADAGGIEAHPSLKQEFRPYLDRLIESVDEHWNASVQWQMAHRRAVPADGSRVEVRFLLDRNGRVSILTVRGDAGKPWMEAAVEGVAAQAREPEGYGVWSDAMVATLGERQELRFTFHY